MAWPELLKAKENIRSIERELTRLLKNHNSLTKKELAKNTDVIIADMEESLITINEHIAGLKKNIDNHKKYVRAKSSFVRRHYTVKQVNKRV